jgi:hypothetical protein
MKCKAISVTRFAAGIGVAAPAFAEMSAEELAKLAQNPIGGGASGFALEQSY